MTYGRSTLGPRGRGMGATAIEYPTTAGPLIPQPPPPPPRTVRATPAMARASRRPFALGMTTDEAIKTVQSEGGKTPFALPSIPSWMFYTLMAVGGYAAWKHYGGGR